MRKLLTGLREYCVGDIAPTDCYEHCCWYFTDATSSWNSDDHSHRRCHGLNALCALSGVFRHVAGIVSRCRSNFAQFHAHPRSQQVRLFSGNHRAAPHSSRQSAGEIIQRQSSRIPHASPGSQQVRLFSGNHRASPTPVQAVSRL